MSIVGISGKKGSGKNTVANILHGIVLKENGFIKDWELGGSGELVVLTVGSEEWAEFDINRKDENFVSYGEHHMWPFVKLYSFADELKRICTELFRIPHDCVWGTEEQKNKKQPHLLWKNMPGVIMEDKVYEIVTSEYPDSYAKKIISTGNYLGMIIKKDRAMTAREFMQFFGTEIGRKMYGPIWIENTIERICKEQSDLPVICDVRFEDEVRAIQIAGGKVVRLNRSIDNTDVHASETALDNSHIFDYKLDNDGLSLTELKSEVIKLYGKLRNL